MVDNVGFFYFNVSTCGSDERYDLLAQVARNLNVTQEGCVCVTIINGPIRLMML